MKKYYLILSILPFLLSGCFDKQDSNLDSSISEEQITEINSLKDGLNYLNKSKNYSLEFTSYSLGPCSFIYTENSLGLVIKRKSSGLNCYIKDETGIYPLNYDDGYIAGEYLVDNKNQYIQDLYENNAISTLYNKESSYISSIDENIAELEVTNKNYKMAFIKSVGYSSTDYINLDSLKISYQKETGLTFSLKMASNPLEIYTLSNIGAAINEDVDNFLSSGGSALKLDMYLSETRRLIRENNFTRRIYDFGTNSYTGEELFNPHYFYSELNGSTYGSGAINLNQKANEEHTNDIYGTYSFVTTGSAKVETSTISLYSVPVYEKPDVISYYHYPTYLKILDNMQYIKAGRPDGVNYSYRGEEYYFDNETFVYDFMQNFSIDNSFDPNTYVPIYILLDITLLDSYTQIIFVYCFEYYSTIYEMPIPLSKFGKSNATLLDKVYEMYND